MAFFAREVIGSGAAVAVLLPVMSVGILSGSLIGAPFLRTFQKRRGTTYVLLFTIAIFTLVPVVSHDLLSFAVILFFGAMGTGIQAVMCYTLIAESVEYQHERFGVRDTGLLTSFTAFTQKVGFALGSALVAWALALAGYHPDVANESVGHSLVILMCAIPIVIAVAQLAIISQYRLDGATTPPAKEQIST
jgi:GPH family glycoside/pentoside/hexuronide:cation symporter